jgi:hypothetical protein
LADRIIRPKVEKNRKKIGHRNTEKTRDFLVPLEDLTLADAVISYEDSLFDLSIKCALFSLKINLISFHLNFIFRYGQ